MREASESTSRGEKARHGETKASGADARRDSDAAAIRVLHLLQARDRSAKRERKTVFVCMPEVSLRLHRRNHVLPVASLQPHRKRERGEENERAVRRAARRSPVRTRETVRAAVGPQRKREKKASSPILSSVGWPARK